MQEAQVRELIVAAMGDGRHEFGSFFLSRFFGMAVSYETDTCVVSLDVKPYMFNPQGSLHGGVLATALDISMGHLLKHQFGAGATLEMKVQYFAPVRSGLVTCRARFLEKGRKTFFLQSAAQDGSGEMIAHATSTWKQL
ncbi:MULTISPECIES: PaaI family thioesterase [unclassified Bradyrhizobium]|uniref:PaaI family thioesterase n=1 Tax=unclassified Bradyrhizobium TaxID=2631580 RepID=UPI002304CA9C|nr:PaaI family thioesterase [Bradyrhizobium sp. CCBAU 25338]MDA9529947.1 thioesterase [Bradyrhizobium sp. CCBAU 25338]